MSTKVDQDNGTGSALSDHAPMKPITVLLAEDHTLVREGLRAMLEVEDDVHVVGEAQTGREAVDLTKRLRPDVVVMDLTMPLLNGFEATRQIHDTVPTTKVVVLSAHTGKAYVEQAVLRGAAGYVVKQTSAEFLIRAIREVHQGSTFFRPSMPGELNGHAGESQGGLGPQMKSASRLTSRETEVLQLIAEGEANKQIAAELGIRIKTVEKHRSQLMRKLDIHDTAGLTRYAVAAGVIEIRAGDAQTCILP